MECFDRMIIDSKYVKMSVEMIFIHNLDYDDSAYKDIVCLKHLSIEKGRAYLLEKKHYDNMFI